MGTTWQHVTTGITILIICVVIWTAVAIMMIATTEALLKLLEIILKLAES